MQNQLLEMINACVSHELRNPLNSIDAQNTMKSGIYQEIDEVLSKFSAEPLQTEGSKKLVSQIKTNFEQLREGLKVQQSSTEIMAFLVQDLLDYAQIKAGKFRKRVCRFNIREAIESVICI
mmetsp:Transcript_5517/g.8657  ORF Transcript_5517/g.8657 Transcript_5517/m.8657 type:complete len:121 (-) Transcript_5517:1112-1474(-)